MVTGSSPFKVIGGFTRSLTLRASEIEIEKDIFVQSELI